MLYSKFTGNQATRWGLSQEKASAEQYVQWKQQQGSAGISVNTECGLVVPTAYPWIAANPDGFVHDPQVLPPLGRHANGQMHMCIIASSVKIITKHVAVVYRFKSARMVSC